MTGWSDKLLDQQKAALVKLCKWHWTGRVLWFEVCSFATGAFWGYWWDL